jgi:hypothetical protein
MNDLDETVMGGGLGVGQSFLGENLGMNGTFLGGAGRDDTILRVMGRDSDLEEKVNELQKTLVSQRKNNEQ